MTYTPEQLREWAEYLAGRGSVWTLPDGIPKPSDLFRAHADALEELARLRSRLEIDFVTDGNGKRVPFPEGGPDGIACRDETIRLLEAALAECRAKLEVDPRTKYDGIDCRDEIIRLLEKELEESARLHGMGESREAALQARLAESERKCERLKAESHNKDVALVEAVYGQPCPTPAQWEKMQQLVSDKMRAEFKEDRP